MLIENPAKFNIDLNGKDADDCTPLHLACMEGHSNIAEMLMQKSAEYNIDLNAKDFYGCTAFVLACKEDHLEIVEMIIHNSKQWNRKQITQTKWKHFTSSTT